MKINFGISQGKGKNRKWKNVQNFEVGKLNMSEENDGRKIRKLIKEKYPDWTVEGYCKTKRKKNDE